MQEAPDPERARKITEQAHRLEGAPYRYGGCTPAGFDCSGFVRYVYQKALNLKLPHSSKRMYAAARPVSIGGECPSDLLFFSLKGDGPTHVGIYLGKGRFIHAPSTGGEVRVSDGNDAYWRKRLLGIGRVLD